MADLFSSTREHDLPPRWDGYAVEWSEWKSSRDVRICPPPKTRERCDACGSSEPPVHSIGRVWSDGTNVLRIRRGRLRERFLVAVIYAFRCPDCQHDQVLDSLRAGGQWWDLDPTDYEDAGSWDATQT